MKTCTKCLIEKPLTEYYKYNNGKGQGLRSRCKSCYGPSLKENSKKHWAHIKHNLSEMAYHRWRNIKNRSMRRGTPFNLPKEDFMIWYLGQSRFCSYCDIPEDHPNFPKLWKGSCLEVDRMNNERGYEMNNITLACPRCNQMKSDFFSHEETREIAQQYIKPKWQMGG